MLSLQFSSLNVGFSNIWQLKWNYSQTQISVPKYALKDIEQNNAERSGIYAFGSTPEDNFPAMKCFH